MNYLNIVNTLTWVIIGQSILLCLMFLTQKKNMYRNIRFVGFIVCLCIEYSAWMMNPLFRGYSVSPSIMMMPFALMVGPFLYLSAYSYKEEEKAKHYLHFIPAMTSLIFLTAYGIMSETDVKDFKNDVFCAIIYGHQFLYCLMVIYIDKRRTGDVRTWNTELFPWVWQISVILLIMLILDAVNYFILGPNSHILYIIELFFEIFLFLCVYRVIGNMPNKEDSNNIAKYLKSSLDRDTADIFSQSIEAAMKKEKLYLQPGLGLPTLAAHLGMATHHVSEILNTCIGMKFYDYVNFWRVKHASELLSNTNNSVLDVAMQSGFNNKVSFHKSFRKWNNCTPSEYRKLRVSEKKT